MTTPLEEARALAAAIPAEQISTAADLYRDLMAHWAIENAPKAVQNDLLQRAAYAAGISGPRRDFLPARFGQPKVTPEVDEGDEPLSALVAAMLAPSPRRSILSLGALASKVKPN
jgi:hypothetical protein